MNRILLREQAANIRLPVEDPRFEHVRGVLRMQAGDTFDIGVLDGPLGKAHIVRIQDSFIEVECQWNGLPPPPPPTGLLLGLCRPPVMKRLLTLLPTLGVQWIRVVQSGRCDPAYAHSRLWKDAGWEPYLIEGLEQAFTETALPQLTVHSSMEDATDDLKNVELCVALDNYEASGPLEEKVAFTEGDTARWIAVGPERGWNANDRTALRKAGFHLASLGDRVLKVETAVTVALYAFNRSRFTSA